TPGLNPLQRGNLIHAVMASFWTETTSSDELQRMDDQQLLDVTRRCVDAVVEDFRRRYRFIDTYWELESQRLVDLASEWLVQEFKRGPFKVVACEQSRVANVGRFVINTRVDRVDQLPNGTQLVIDYKTGPVVRSGWDLPRLDQPQLPIYAASARAHERIAGIAYAGIKKGQCRFVDEPRGAGLEALSSAETQADWQSETDAWRRELEALAGEIQDGFAITNPKRGAATCNYCDLHVLCRIHERGRSGADDDAADE
ncbi:MAG: PD-(D/E)XK nuclease family protein, partial [Gammaproteobacteria bacterium]